MTRVEMDALNVGDKLWYRVYSQLAGDYAVVEAVVVNVYVTADGGLFVGGAKQSVWIEYECDGRTYKDVADPDLAKPMRGGAVRE